MAGAFNWVPAIAAFIGEEMFEIVQAIGFWLTVATGVMFLSLTVGLIIGQIIQKRDEGDDEWRNRWH